MNTEECMICDEKVYHLYTGMQVALVVNNLGGTSNLELSIVTNGAIRYLGTCSIPTPSLLV